MSIQPPIRKLSLCVALEIDKGDFPAELDRLRALGLDVTTVDHRWCRWRSMYVRDPEGNILELVCYDESIASSPGRCST